MLFSNAVIKNENLVKKKANIEKIAKIFRI